MTQSAAAILQRKLLPLAIGGPLVVAALALVAPPAVVVLAALVLAVALAALVASAASRSRDASEARETAIANARFVLESTVVERTRELSENNRRLREGERRFRALVEGAPDATLIVDARGVITLANKSAEDLFGVSASDLAGRRADSLLPPRYRDKPIFAPTGARGPSEGTEIAGLRASGEEFPLEISVSPIEMDEGTIVSASMRDITPRKAAENALRASLAEKEALLREVHHRVKNNLQVTSGLLSLQSSQARDEETRALFRDSMTRIKSMSLVHEKLYETPGLSSVDLGAYANDLVSELMRAYVAPERGIQLSTDVPHIAVELDTAVNFGLIVNELIANCMKHAFPNGRTGHVDCSARVEGDLVSLVVADDGVGFAGDALSSPQETLGLKLVQGLARQLGGEMSIEPDGKGASVRVELPRAPRFAHVVAEAPA